MMSPRSYRFALTAAFLLPGLDISATDSAFSCAPRSREQETPKVAIAEPAKAEPATLPGPEPAKVEAKAPEAPAPPSPRDKLKSWLAALIPPAGAVEDDGPTVSVVHTAKKGETLKGLATAYIDVTQYYGEGDFISAMLKANPGSNLGALAEGQKIRIPGVLPEVPKTGDEARLGWPKDDGGALRGIYANATMAGHPSFPVMLDKMAARGMNALVLDVKDVTGFFTYPSKIPLALAVNANKHATIASLERVVRFSHARGIRVVARVSCFRDENIGPRKHELAVQKKGGGPHVAPSKVIDWLDPSNEQVQNYLLEVVDEALAAGVDEIQLDYVRYPTEGIWDADFRLKEKKLSTAQVITGFVKRVHEHTSKASAPLSLDVFGVVAWRDARDIEATGQDLRMLAPHIEALSPMVYPSHFADGFNGYEKPGDHADVVAIGTKKAVDEIKAISGKTVIRPWVQAFPWKTTSFGPQYIADQIKEAKNGGGVGWLAWNSGGEYGATFVAVPPQKTVVATK